MLLASPSRSGDDREDERGKKFLLRSEKSQEWRISNSVSSIEKGVRSVVNSAEEDFPEESLLEQDLNSSPSGRKAGTSVALLRSRGISSQLRGSAGWTRGRFGG